MPRWRLPRPRFSLLTLLLGVLFVGACGGVWWRWEPWAERPVIPRPADVFIMGSEPVFSPDGRTIARLFTKRNEAQEGLLVAWDAVTGRQRFAVTVDRRSNSIEFSPLGTYLVVWDRTAGDATKCRVWKAMTGEEVVLSGNGPVGVRFDQTRVRFGSFSKLEKYVLVSDGGAVFLLEAATGRTLFRVAKDGLTAFTFSPNDRWLAVWRFLSETESRVIDVWNLETGTLSWSLDGCFPLFSPDANRLIYNGEDEIEVFSLSEGKQIATAPGSLGASWDSGHSTNRTGTRFVIRRSEDCFVWDTDFGKEVCRLEQRGPNHGWDQNYLFVSGDRRVQEMDDTWANDTYDAETGARLTRRWFEGGLPSLDGSYRLIAASFMVPFESGLYFDEVGGPHMTKLAIERGDADPFARCWGPDLQFVLEAADLNLHVFIRRRPEYWWGIAWLPEFWVACFSGGALLVIAARRVRRRFARKGDVEAPLH